MINYIKQPTPLTCGQSCIAMLAKTSVEEVIDKMVNDGSTHHIDIINGLNACGVKCDDKYTEVTKENPMYPPVCVLLVWFPTYGHWVVHYHGKFYDPEFGLLEECVSHGRIGEYLGVYLYENDGN